MKIDEDRFSALPDELLYEILSIAGIDMKHLLHMSLYSKRWRHVWRSFPVINFTHDFCQPKNKFQDFVNQVLYLRDPSSDIKTFSLFCQKYNHGADQVESWIASALKAPVHELFLHWVNLKPDSICFSANINTLTLKSLAGGQFLGEIKLPHVQNFSMVRCRAESILAPQVKILNILMEVGCRAAGLKICAPKLKNIQIGLYWDFNPDKSNHLDAPAQIDVEISGTPKLLLRGSLYRIIRGILKTETQTLSVYGFKEHVLLHQQKYVRLMEQRQYGYIHTWETFLKKFDCLKRISFRNEQITSISTDDGDGWGVKFSFKVEFMKKILTEIQNLDDADEKRLAFLESITKHKFSRRRITINLKKGTT